MGDVKNYDYAVLENCINLMVKKTQDIEAQTQQLNAEVKGLMGTWAGSTATMYDATAADLQKELDRSNQNLEITRKALEQGVSSMQTTDGQGSKNMQQR